MTARRRPEALVEQLTAIIPEVMCLRHLPGLAIAVALRREVVWKRGFGFADLRGEVPMTPMSVMRLIFDVAAGRLLREDSGRPDPPARPWAWKRAYLRAPHGFPSCERTPRAWLATVVGGRRIGHQQMSAPVLAAVPQIHRRLRTTTYDVIVAGVGGMGSAACYHLARRGRRVLGLERFTVPNEMGSSHGVTRIIRLAYYEDPRYVPLLRRAYELWGQLERQAGRRLLHVTGCLEIGLPDSAVVAGALRSCRLHDLAHEELTAADVNRRFPAWRLPPDLVAVLEPQGGFLEPEACIESHARLAADCGAEIHAGERVTGWEPVGDGVRVTTERGTHHGSTLVITAGAWAATLEPALEDLAVPERQVLGWFDTARPERFAADTFPVFLAEVPEGHYYGFPRHAVPGFKIGRMHHRGQVVSADDVDRATDPEDEAVLRAFNGRYVPDADGALLDSRVCMFTNSPDRHFIIDRHPRHPQVLIAVGFSGHGYKFCSVVGEILADLAIAGHTDHAIGFLGLGRFR